MAFWTILSGPLLVVLLKTLVLSDATMIFGVRSSDVSLAPEEQPGSQVGWLFGGVSGLHGRSRLRRSLEPLILPVKLIDEPECKDDIGRFCRKMEKNNDDLFVLECIQTFKENEVSSITEECQNKIWAHIVNLMSDATVKKLTNKVCGQELEKILCTETPVTGTYLSCLVDKREQIKNRQCSKYIQRLEWVAFSDYRIIPHFVTDCQEDIIRFKCGRIQHHSGISQGQTLACLQQQLDSLGAQCRKRILHLSEIQADNIELDRQLYMACTQDHYKFCPDIVPGSGQVYKCLMMHKMEPTMTRQCQDQLERREKLIAADYKVSKGLVRACKDDIRNHHCRRSVSEDKEIRLAQILLCLESEVRNGTKIAGDCQAEMFDHRRILMEDYRLSPEIVNDCADDITTFCDGLEVGGKTIHCLMEHTRTRKKKARVAAECQRALEGLVKSTDVGENWRVDPVLREACQPVVDVACTSVRGGEARVISCLMDKLETDRMTEACETALVQIKYFVARDFKLEPQLYRACRADAVRFCHAKKVWAGDGTQMDPERGPLILPCLHRYAYHPQKNMTLKPGCLEEIKRVMRQRAVNVDLQPEVEEVCLKELASFCYDKTAKGEEILCLQQNLERLNEKCRQVVGNLTEEQAEHVELNPVITTACQHIMERFCQAELKSGKDEGDLMECLIEHKNDPDVRSDYKCRTAVEHFQLISLKSYHFTYKFKEACKPHVMRWCPTSKTKPDVIECLSSMVQKDVMTNTQHRVPKECRQQLKAQLYQQRENIQFDPNLQTLCASDIVKLCQDVNPGSSQVLECLASKKNKLTDPCHRQLFKVRKQELQDSSSDFTLLNTCRAMVRQFCHDVDQSQALDCLKRYKAELTFDEKCKDTVIRRMIEQNTDYRFNPSLQAACSLDIHKHCKYVLANEELDKELQGKVIKCLKIKFREAKLLTKCEQQMANILREAALNYHLNPLLATMCAHEIDTICQREENDHGAVEECLKTEFNAGNRDMREECRLEVADLIEQARADINVDPLLHKACAVDVSKYCSDIPQGAGRHIMCLQNVLQGSNKSLQEDCYRMLTTRMEMFRNAAQLIALNGIKDLYTTVNKSPARGYFIIVAFTGIGVIFFIGLFCGRVTRRRMLMKNK